MATQKPVLLRMRCKKHRVGGLLRHGIFWSIVEPIRLCLCSGQEQRASLDRRGGAGVVAGCGFVVEAESERKLKKGGSPIFHQDSKTIVADHQQLKSAIGAAATSFRARPIWSFVSLLTACLLESGATALIFARFYVSPPCRIQPASGFAGSNPSA